MSEDGTVTGIDERREWPTHCDACGTRLEQAVVDFDKTNADRPELRPGEMAAIDYCPNPDCPAHRPGSESSLCASRTRSASSSSNDIAHAESAIDSGRLAPGIGITLSDSESSQARHTCCVLTSRFRATSSNAAHVVPRVSARRTP